MDQSKFRDLVSLLVIKVLHIGVKSRQYSACVQSVVLYGTEI